MSPSPRSEQVWREATRDPRMRHDEEERKDEKEAEEGWGTEGLTLLFAGLHGQSRFDVPSLSVSGSLSIFRTTQPPYVGYALDVPCVSCTNTYMTRTHLYVYVNNVICVCEYHACERLFLFYSPDLNLRTCNHVSNTFTLWWLFAGWQIWKTTKMKILCMNISKTARKIDYS